MTTERNSFRLEALSRYPTHYEVVLTDGASVYRLGYTARHSRAGLIAQMAMRGDAIIALTAMPDDARFTMAAWKSSGIDLGYAGWRVKFTGRTERDAIINGERPFILDATTKEQTS